MTTNVNRPGFLDTGLITIGPVSRESRAVQLRTDLVLDALEMALRARRAVRLDAEPPHYPGPFIHLGGRFLALVQLPKHPAVFLIHP